MTPFRAFVRRTFPYFAIAIGGFAVAYVIVYAFVLPSRVVPVKAPPEVVDSSHVLRPIETPPPEPVEADPFVATVPMGSTAPIPVLVPNLVGMNLPDARGVLNSLRLNTVVRRDTSSLAAPDMVLRQIPEPNAKVSANGTVILVVSIFPTTDSAAAPPSRPLPPIQPEPDSSAPAPTPVEPEPSDTTR